MKHICRESKTCTCSIVGLELDESCPVHGAGEYPPRCCVCGRFCKRIPPVTDGEILYAGMRLLTG